MISLSLVRKVFVGAALMAAPCAGFSQFVISVGFAPPILPVYAQPICPGEGYLWTPGYWAYGDAGYYWVPGVWVQPPTVGYLWTPPYWGFAGGAYGFHRGYWGPHVGFYGGVNYGFGYGGAGFGGGYWNGGHLFYNTAVNNFGGNYHPTNVYVKNVTVINNNNTYNRVSYNGGNGGVPYQASAEERRAENERHVESTNEQQQHFQAAARDRSQLASVNNGRPATLAAQNTHNYTTVAQQHEHIQPITPTDRAQGKAYQPNGRAANQDQRIANGLKTGQLTSGEAAKAENRQTNIDSQIKNDRTANGGTLTGQQRQQINREQNGSSNQINRLDNNGNRVAPNAVDNRAANQQQRTANGLRTGQVTAGEAGRANANQAGTAQAVHNDRTANGGALNQQQRQQINQQQNRNSGQVYNQNHNNVNRPAPPANRPPAPAPQPNRVPPHEAPGSGAQREHPRR